MSWSISATTGDPAAVKKVLVREFHNATACVLSNPHALAQVEAAAGIVNSQLDFMIEQGFPAVKVWAQGSCADDYAALEIKVEPTWDFLVKPVSEPAVAAENEQAAPASDAEKKEEVHAA